MEASYLYLNIILIGEIFFIGYLCLSIIYFLHSRKVKVQIEKLFAEKKQLEASGRKE